MSQPRIIIAGAGPVGVVSALALAQYGYAVTLLEADAVIDENPRAATTHPSTLEMIARVELIDQFIKEGLVERYFQFWDKPSRTKIVEFDHELLRDETPYPFVVQTEQHKLARMGIERLKNFADVDVRFSTNVTGVTQDSDRATVTAEGPNGLESYRGDWVIGADGGRSTVRKALEIVFEGFTWPEHFLVLTTTEDFQQLLLGCCYRNYLDDPDEWTNLFKVAGDDGKGRWRAVFPTRVEESDEQALGDESTYSRLQKGLSIESQIQRRASQSLQSSSKSSRHFPQRPGHSRGRFGSREQLGRRTGPQQRHSRRDGASGYAASDHHQTSR